ncbi:MAG: HEPN domain-containing protein [Candidatus Omnitrophota bacterium]|nr:HEPN domain-containing protein [Candidatus Omnitrophota bacterium]
MVDLDLERAKRLLKSAEDLLDRGDLQGIAGLAYQAFESANIALLKKKNGCDQKSHFGRRKRAKELLSQFEEKIDGLWKIRNIDFYGNAIMDGEEEEINQDEVKEGIDVVRKIIKEIEQLLN